MTDICTCAKFRFASSFRNRKLRDCDHGIRKIDEQSQKRMALSIRFSFALDFSNLNFTIDAKILYCNHATMGCHCEVNIKKKNIYKKMYMII